jgi:hypothetical protein
MRQQENGNREAFEMVEAPLLAFAILPMGIPYLII